MITELVSTDEKHRGHNKPAICHVGSAEIVKLEAVMERGEWWNGWIGRTGGREKKNITIKTLIKPPVISDFNFEDTKTIHKKHSGDWKY